jgi:hypothetical protein
MRGREPGLPPMLTQHHVSVYGYELQDYGCVDGEELRRIISRERQRPFNSIIISHQDQDELTVMYNGEKAVVLYHDIINKRWYYSYNLAFAHIPDRGEMIRLSPDDAEDFSFCICNLISKTEAFQIVFDYCDRGYSDQLYTLTRDLLPQGESGGPDTGLGLV